MGHPEIAAIRQSLAQGSMGSSFQEMRAGYDALGSVYPTASDVVAAPVNAGGVPAEWTRAPGAVEDRAILYLHGGGYVIGSIASHRHLASELGRAAGTRTLALDYRLAPEHPFPAAVEDAIAGYRFLLDSGLAPGSIAVAGDSAGGGLTIATLLAAREAGLPQPACAVAISPWTDLAISGATMKSKAHADPMVQEPGVRAMAEAYLAGADARSPLASPLYADLGGLAPMLIHVGADETLLDDAVRLAGEAGAAHVPVRLEIWPEMVHVWHFFHPVLGPGREAIAGAGQYIREQMG
jgi:acetyl esterase/lipase